MGASESKLVFKQGIFRLSEEQAISITDPYWTSFWELPESVEDVFSLFSPSDIRRTRDVSLGNLETLLLVTTSRLKELKSHAAFPDADAAPEREALNCIRVLTRALPYVYEAEQLADWEERFFWTPRRRKSQYVRPQNEVLFDESQQNDAPQPPEADNEYESAQPLAEELLDTLIDLLFCSGFTIPRIPGARGKVTYTIWQSGVGCKQSIGTNKEIESNRCEVLRLLLTIMSKSMYMPAGSLTSTGVRATTYLATCSEKQVVLSVLCSLLNTTIKYNAATWRIPYDQIIGKDSKQALVVYSLQTLLVLLIYSVPEDRDHPQQKNMYRHFLGRLHRPEDFQFLADGMTRVLSQPMQATSYLPGTQKQSKWAPEVIMLFWETLQCNKRFRSFIIESSRMHDFVVLMLFYALEHKADPSWQGVVRICVFVLQTMSVEPVFGKHLCQRFEAQDTLPQSMRLTSFRGSYADFLIISIHTLITTSRGRLEAIYPALLAVISNIAAHTQHLSVAASTRLFQLLAVMSSPTFLLANETNHNLLQSLLESINTMIEHQYVTNPNLIYIALRSRKRIEALRTFTLAGGQQELARAAQRRKDGVELPDPDSFLRSSRTSTSESLNVSRRSSAQTGHHVGEDTFRIADSDDEEEEDDDHDNDVRRARRSGSRTESMASSSAAANDTTPSQLHGLSEKARGKQPASSSSLSRQDSSLSLTQVNPGAFGFSPSSAWLESWLPELPLHTLLTLTETLASKLAASQTAAAGLNTTNADTTRDTSPGPHQISEGTLQFLQYLPQSVELPAIQALLATPSPLRVHLFEWSTLSLGWYTSILWSLVYASEMVVAPAPSSTANTITNTVTGSSGNGIGPIGIWNGTNVKLFAVHTEGRREGPSLSQPRGAVDAVGTKLMDGVKGLNLGGFIGRATNNTGGVGLASPRDERARSTGSMREI